MAVRQYIGARYVTKIYENSLDPSSAEWEAGVSYEPLTLVTYMNSSYLSKKAVAPSVGDPASNPVYWCLTGAYNGQILTLQNQVSAINTQLNEIEKRLEGYAWTIEGMSHKTVILIGDSWGDRPAFSINSWTELIEPYFDKVYESSAGGYSFNLMGYSYITLLNNIVVDAGDHIDAIIAIGGANGVNAGDVTAFINACKTAYPDAEIIIGCNGPCMALSTYYARERIVEKECATANVKCFNGLWKNYAMRSTVSNWHTDYYHMIDYTNFTNNLVSYLVTGVYIDMFNTTAIPSYIPTSLGSALSDYFLDGGSRGYSRCGDSFQFYFKFTKGTNFASASNSISITNGSYYNLVSFNDVPNIVSFYANNRPTEELNNKGFEVYNSTYFNLYLVPASTVTPYPRLVLYAKDTGTFTKAQMFPDAQIELNLKGRQFDFCSPNDRIANSISFSSDNI